MAEVKQGYLFQSRKEKYWQVLTEGHGVVVVTRDDGLFSAWDAIDDFRTFMGGKNLGQNLAGAKRQYPGQAFLVIRRDGVLVWLKELEKTEPNKKQADVLPWKLRARYRFGLSRAGDDVA